MKYAFPSRLSEHIRDGRWTEQQLRAMGVVIIEFVLTLPLDKKAEDVCTRCLVALRLGDEAELCAAATAATAAAAANATHAANAATAATYATAAAYANAAAYAATAATYANAAAATAANAAYAAARAAPRCSSPGKARIRKNFNFMIAQLALIVG